MSRRARNRPNKRGAVYVNAHVLAIEGAGKIRPEARTELHGIIERALSEFRAGHDCGKYWRDMADALNTSESLSSMGIASDADSVARIVAAQTVLADVAERQAKSGSWTLRGPELQALDDGLWVARIQLEHCSLAEFERARRMVEHKTRAAHAGSMPSGARIVEVAQ